MRIWIDTNIFLDVIQRREPFFEASVAVLAACREGPVQGSISAQSVADMFYILRKDFSVEERRRILRDICQLMNVEAVTKEILVRALANHDFDDFEDCLQSECAIIFGADYIVTRNIRHFSGSPIPAITPNDFCKNLSMEQS